jgi:muramoyltetrapeptide carboxypeptidase
MGKIGAMIRPPRLRPGSRIALIAPAGAVAPERVEAALERCARFGFEPVLGASARGSHGYLAGTDEERLADFRHAVADPEIDALWAIRGGYGTMRLLSRLDLSPLIASPRAFIGFSDNTAVHLALQARRLVSFHGPHAGGDASELSERCLRDVLCEATAAGVLEQPLDRPAVALSGGSAEGALMGGNLALLAAMCGTPAPPVADGAILFIEDIGEAAYRVDRAWTQLELSGMLDGVAGIAIGSFTECGEGVQELLYEVTTRLGVPVVSALPIGHEPDNWTLPLGIRARLDAAQCTLELLEPAVS